MFLIVQYQRLKVNFLLCIAGYHTLYEWYRTKEGEHFPDPTGLRARLEEWTYGLYPACIKYLMSAFDIPEVRKLFPNSQYTFFFLFDQWLRGCCLGHGCLTQ